jgi:predicted RecA/RadA family phage recombinase
MKRNAKRCAGFVVALVAMSATFAGAQSTTGRWDASVNVEGTIVPFRLDIEGEGKTLIGTLYNGDQKETTTSAEVQNGSVVLHFDHYLTTITATPKGGKLEGAVEGRFEVDKYLSSYPFDAKPYTTPAVASARTPAIAGDWIVPIDSPKGEKAWRFIVQQTGSEVSAAILRSDFTCGWRYRSADRRLS